MTSQLALGLFFDQTGLGRYEWQYMLMVNALSLFQFLLMLRYYPALKYVFIAWFSAISAYSAIRVTDNFYDDIGFQLSFGCSVFFLPIVALFTFYRQRQQIATSLMACGLGTSLFLWFLTDVEDIFDSLFATGVITFVWFAMIAVVLLKLFPKGKFHHVPLALGAWFAGVVFSAAFLVFWDSASLLLSIILFIGCLIGLRKVSQPWLRQLLYSLLVCGQIATLVHLVDKTHSLLIPVLVQLLCAVAVFWIRPHWVVVWGQWASLYALTLGYWEFDSHIDSNLPIFMTDMLFLTSVFALTSPLAWRYRRAIWLLVATVLSLSTSYRLLELMDSLGLYQQVATAKLVYIAVFMLWFVAFIGTFIKIKANRGMVAVVLGFAVIMALLGYYELVVLLLGLAFALRYEDKLIYAVYLLAIVLFLWQLYYRLELDFLAKSLTIFASGLGFWVLSELLKRCQPAQNLFTLPNHTEVNHDD